MAAFQFPDPADTQTVVNPITGSTYQWKEPPGKWVVTTKMHGVSDIIYEGDNPPNPVGDYKLWYSTDTLELYFHYCDARGVCAWVPTSAPITMLEDLDAGLSELKAQVVAINQATNTNENRIETIIAFSETAPTAYPDAITPVVDDAGNPLLDENGEQVVTYTPDPANHKFWLKTSTNELHILRLQDEDLRTYEYELIAGVTETPNLQAVLTAGNVSDKNIILTNAADTAFLLSPGDGRLMVGGYGADAVPRFELRHQDELFNSSAVYLELDEGGKRFDVECEEGVDNIHFRFGEDDKLVLNKKGDAIFEGDVQVKGSLKSNGITNQGNATFKTSSNELVTIDSGSSYLPMLHLKSFSSTTATTDGDEPEVNTFARKDVFLVRASGEAELSGHLSVMPGERDNQAVTYNQLLELEQEIEALVPSVERGQFEITLETIDSGAQYDGKFNLFREFTSSDKSAADNACLQAYSDCIFDDIEGTRNCQQELEACTTAIPAVGSMVTTVDFGLTRQIKFSPKDINGDNHNWSTVAVGQLIEIFNQEDDSYLIAEITATEGTGNLTTISVTPIKYKGSATGVCRIKIFELDLSAGSDLDFVRIRGSNKVENDWKIESTNKTHFHVQDSKTKIYWLQDPESAQHPVTLAYANRSYFRFNKRNETTDPIWIRPKNADGEIKGGAGVGNMLVVNQESENQGSIIRIQQGGEDCLKVEVDKSVNLFNNIVKNLGDPRLDDDGKKDAVNRDYVDNKVASINTLNDIVFGRKFKYGYTSTLPRDDDGYCYFGSNYLYVSTEDLDKMIFEIHCDLYSDREVTGSSQRHAITISEQNADGVWHLIGSGYWPGKTDCRTGYVYIKDVTWTKSNFVKGTEYRIKVSPFW